MHRLSARFAFLQFEWYQIPIPVIVTEEDTNTADAVPSNNLDSQGTITFIYNNVIYA